MTDYHAYLIRLWRDHAQRPWRAELVSPQSGETRRFATPEQAYAWLQERLGGEVGAGNATETERETEPGNQGGK